MTAPTAARSNQFGERFYPIPDPKTGETVDLPSVTRVMKVLANEGLNTWKNKLITWVVATNPDLQALAATATTEKDKVLYDVVKQAMNRRPSAANVGTAAHTLSEQADAGTLDLSTLGSATQPIMERYEALRARYQWTVVLSEVTAYNHAVGYAGTFDRILDIPGLGRVIADLKTGKDVYGDTALQLAALANGEGLYDGLEGLHGNPAHQPYPDDLRRDVGVVIHVPATPDPKSPPARLLLVDLTEAWPAFQACVGAYRWVGGPAKSAVQGEVELPPPPGVPSTPRGEVVVPSPTTSPDRSSEVGRASASVEDPVNVMGETQANPDTRPGSGAPLHSREALIRRLENVKANTEALAALAQQWPDGVPTFKQSADHDEQQLFWIEAAINRVEKQFELPFEQWTPEQHQAAYDKAITSLLGVFPGTEIVSGGAGDDGPPTTESRPPDTGTLNRLVAKHGSRAAVLGAGKAVATRLGIDIPRSAQAVADTPQLADALLK